MSRLAPAIFALGLGACSPEPQIDLSSVQRLHDHSENIYINGENPALCNAIETEYAEVEDLRGELRNAGHFVLAELMLTQQQYAMSNGISKCSSLEKNGF